MVHHSQSSPQSAVRPPRTIPPSINVRNHLAQRRAVAKALDRVFVTGRRFRNGEMTARVLVAGDVYDVDAVSLSQLQAGLVPADIGLEPISEDE